MEKKLDLILGELQKMNDRVTDIDGRMTNIENKVTSIDSRVTNIENKVIDIDGRVTNIENKVTDIDGRVTNIENKVTDIDGRVTKIENRVTIVEDSMATKHDIEAVHLKLEQLSKKMDAQHVESIDSDHFLLNEMRSLRESVVFVNRRIADAELEINLLKHTKQ